MNASDGALVEEFRKGDLSAFDQLVKHYDKRVFSYIYRMIGDYHESEDVFQDVMAKLYFSMETFRGRSSFSTWLFSIARNQCLDKLRKRKMRSFISYFVPEFLLNFTSRSGKSPDAVVLDNDARRAVLEAVDTLPETQKEVVILKYGCGFTFGEISSITGIPESTARSRMLYALTKLRGHLKAAEGW